MRKETIVGIAIEVIGNGGGIGLQIAGYTNPPLGWGIIGASSLVGLFFIIWGLRKKDSPVVDLSIQAWEHFNKLKEAIINLQGSSQEEINKGIKIIESERVYLDDSELQNYLDSFLNAVEECRRYGVAISNIQINPIISWLAKRRNKRG